MQRVVAISLVCLWVITACGSNTTVTPTADALPTITPTATANISAQDITAVATFIRTLPPSFTPTFTPSITPTRNTDTPTPPPSATTIPEADLCERFLVSSAPVAEVNLDDLDDVIQVYIDEPTVTISGEVTNLTTDEVVDSFVLQGDAIYEISFAPEFYPEVGDYEVTLTLSDATRDGMCENITNFDTRPDESPNAQPTPEITAEITETAEMTAELTEVIEATVELTAELTEAVEVTIEISESAEVTAEVTEVVEITPEITESADGTIEPTTETPVDRPRPQFPPR
ncbi:MAG: hypothetical protein AAF846_29705 [Chloroflexota bacterium]